MVSIIFFKIFKVNKKFSQFVFLTFFIYVRFVVVPVCLACVIDISGKKVHNEIPRALHLKTNGRITFI